jgi:hypothetical protein
MSDHASEYVAARRVLLDALEALDTQREAIVVVGAQAVYLRTGDAGIVGVAPYTTDADLTLSPSHLADTPHIDDSLRAADFRQKGDPGIWFKSVESDGLEVELDVMVAQAFAPGQGRRSVSLPPHDRMLARRAEGLEGSMIDNDPLEIAALVDSDERRYTVRVAGSAALVIAKSYKIRDRLAADKEDRIVQKDAADVYRIMLREPTSSFATRCRPLLEDSTAGPACRRGIALMQELFGRRGRSGIAMAVESLRGAVPPERVTAVMTNFVTEVVAELKL